MKILKTFHTQLKLHLAANNNTFTILVSFNSLVECSFIEKSRNKSAV